ncbi:MAG: dienelactone hydrolase family protein [Chloroflexota bacterium]
MAELIHETQPVAVAGAKLEDADVAVILVHGRGGGVQSILSLINHIKGEKIAYLAPAAEGNTWYPNRFIAPRASNQPKLDSALATVKGLLNKIKEAGIPPEKTVIMGFSQGACLAVESAARYPQTYGGVVALSGGLIGAEGELTGYEGSLEGTPVFLGCSDIDFHIPVERVHETRDIMSGLGATVDERIYPGMGHTINQDEMDAVNAIISNLLKS